MIAALGVYMWDLTLVFTNVNSQPLGVAREPMAQDGVNGLWTEKEMTVEAVIEEEK